MKGATAKDSNLTKRKGLSYLTERLPQRSYYAAKLVERLNNKGLTSANGLPYNETMIYNAVRGTQPDNNIKKELLIYMAQEVGKEAEIEVILDVAAELLLANQ